MDFKPQDILFVLIFTLLIPKRDPKFFVLAGLFSLTLAIPLFAQWVFFTAQRLVMYSGAFFLLAVFITLLSLRKEIDRK